jgi:hypothetical protein
MFLPSLPTYFFLLYSIILKQILAKTSKKNRKRERKEVRKKRKKRGMEGRWEDGRKNPSCGGACIQFTPQVYT